MIEGESEPMASLRQFVRGVDREQAFARVAEYFGGLIYTSAYRSTGNAALSEEIMQNVLIALSRKAPSLLKHPSLAGWVFQTTRFETVNAKRKEKRRAEKHEAYQAEEEILLGNDGSWDKAMPLLDESIARLSGKERDLVLCRFFEMKKFAVIAAENGISEAAVKMRLKRILSKMSDWMRRRGVGLPAVGMGAMLSSELAKGAPMSLGRCAAGALKLAGETPVGMFSALGSSKVMTVSVIALTIGTAIPATKMLNEIRDLREQCEDLAGSTGNLVSQRTGSRTRTVRDAVRSLSGDEMKHLTMEELAMQIVLADERDDILAEHKVGLVLAEMEFEEFKDLLRALFALPIEDQRKVSAEHDLKFYHDKLYPKEWRGRDEIEFSIAHGAPAKLVGYKYRSWIGSSPGMGQAIAWFEKNRETRLFDGPKGTREYHRYLLHEYLQTSVNFQRLNSAREIFELHHSLPEDWQNRTFGSMANRLVRVDLPRAIKEARQEQERDRKRIWIGKLLRTLSGETRNGKLAEWARKHDFDEQDVMMFVREAYSDGAGGAAFGDRMAWLELNQPVNKSYYPLQWSDLLESDQAYRFKLGVKRWIDEAPAGAAKDAVLSNVVAGMSFSTGVQRGDRAQEILGYLRQIESEELKRKAVASFLDQGSVGFPVDHRRLEGLLEEHGIEFSREGAAE